MLRPPLRFFQDKRTSFGSSFLGRLFKERIKLPYSFLNTRPFSSAKTLTYEDLFSEGKLTYEQFLALKQMEIEAKIKVAEEDRKFEILQKVSEEENKKDIQVNPNSEH
jgi:hypothetical protein